MGEADARFVVEESALNSSNSVADLKELRGPGVSAGPGPDAGEFRDDDAGYLAWLAAHPDGFVINMLRSHSATAARLHHVGCWTISGKPSNGVALTHHYVKVCAEQLA